MAIIMKAREALTKSRKLKHNEKKSFLNSSNRIHTPPVSAGFLSTGSKETTRVTTAFENRQERKQKLWRETESVV
jgi:hypothetical protein